MKIEQFRQRAGVTEKYGPGAGATALLRNSRVGCAALVAPASAFELSRTYLSRTPDRSALDMNEIKSGSISDPVCIWNISSRSRNPISTVSMGDSHE